MTDFAHQRERMVAAQLARRGIRDPAVLAAFRAVPREAFVPPEYAGSAYDDRPLPIGAGQTISQPYIVALMIEAAAVCPTSKVLEVGAGSGYAAALLGHIANHVTAIERHAELAVGAAERLARIGIANVAVVEGDGSLGWPQGAPFDAILVAASAPAPPRPLLEQLAPGGRMVMPVGGSFAQELICFTRKGDDAFDRQMFCGVRFVPLIGRHGVA